LGDQVVRRTTRRRPELVHITPEKPRGQPVPPALLLVYGFAILSVVGAAVLSLPISTRSGQFADPITALFTATSAVCVTGLAVVDTSSYWSVFGQAVILALVQIGGLGFMVSATVLFVALGRRVTLRDRLLLRESVGGGALGGIERLALQVVATATAIEFVGVIVLFFGLLPHYDPPQALWHAVFHAVNGFNNAGFSITADNQSLVPYQGNVIVLAPMAILIFLGGISYTVIRDVVVVRRFRGFLLDTKLVLVVTAFLLAVGAVSIFLSELGNPVTHGTEPLWEQVVDSVFLSVSARTAGFNVQDIGQLQDYTLFVLILLMFIGGASGSTAGGIKVNTFAALIASILASVRGRERTEAFSREIPEDQVRRALTLGAIGVIWVNISLFVMTILEQRDFIALFFETVSALGTVGLSTGITPDLQPLSKIVLIVTMFMGRLGLMTIGLALAARQQQAHFRRAQERVKIG
jgi:trk system potassium uptake protein TrkH